MLPSHLADAVERSRRLLDLAAGWDDDGAQPISHSAYRAAVAFLERLWDAALLGDGVVAGLGAPDVGPCADGSVDLWWSRLHNDGVRLLINFAVNDNGVVVGEFFGDNGGQLTVNGSITSDEVPTELAAWLKAFAASPSSAFPVNRLWLNRLSPKQLWPS